MRRMLCALAMTSGMCLGMAFETIGQVVPMDNGRPAILVPNSTSATQYNPSSGFPEQNGPLSGMVIVIPQQDIEEFNKPSGTERHINRVARAEPGAVLAIKLVFVGIESDWDDNVDVTYDLSITAPDGRTYGEAYSALSGVKGKLGRAQGVYDNRNKIVLMQFEDHDVPGTYVISAVLRDKVAGRELPLKTQIELIKRAEVTPAVEVPGAVSATTTMTLIPDSQPKAKPVRKGKKTYRKRRR